MSEDNKPCLCCVCGGMFTEETPEHNCPLCGANEFNWFQPEPEAVDALREYYVAEYRAGLGNVEGCTPGPWEWLGESLVGIKGPQDFVFVLDDPMEGEGIPNGEKEANKALVASAPDMAAEIQALQRRKAIEKLNYVTMGILNEALQEQNARLKCEVDRLREEIERLREQSADLRRTLNDTAVCYPLGDATCEAEKEEGNG